MKRKQVLIGCLLVLLSSVTGCTAGMNHSSNENEEKLVYSEMRKRPFGEYSYETDQTGIEKDAINRLGIELPPIMKQMQKIIEKEGAVKGTKMEMPVFYVNSEKSTLTIREVIAFRGEENRYWSYGEVIGKYKYHSKKKQVRLASQEINFYNWIEDGDYHGNDLSEFILRISKEMQLKDPEKVAETFQKETQGKKSKELKGKTIELYNDMEYAHREKVVGRIFTVSYSADNGVLEKISAAIHDYEQ